VYTVTFSCHLFTVTFSGWLRTVRDPAYRNERSEGFFRGCLLSDGPPRWLRYRSRATRMAAAHYGDPAYRNERSEGFFRSCLLSDGAAKMAAVRKQSNQDGCGTVRGLGLQE
jgi:hypothetical protein